ncbi:MAG: peptide chain release factor N(5)-glutamine methyltransferase [Oscillospiraceae bacterium]|nr:peptide chain release factor N(5)-glutamine methyltransferase [Oscillospiraceae bacterium]
MSILQQAGIENAAREAAWIVKYGKGDLLKLARRRANGEPLQYLLGEWEFYGYPFKVGKGVLIPRPETELLVDLAKEYCHRDSEVKDLCAGSGCVGITLAKETKCYVYAVEKSPEAIGYLKKNIELNNVQNRVQIVERNILSHIEWYKIMQRHSQNRVVLINPPYLSADEMANLQREVTHEPRAALDGGGADGLNFYRNFFEKWGAGLQFNALTACEVGDAQAEAVCEMFERVGLRPQTLRDLGGIERVVYNVH